MYVDTRPPQATNQTCPTGITCQNLKVQVLLNELMDDDNSDSQGGSETTSESWKLEDPSRPWLHGFCKYLNIQDILSNFLIIQWWGINSVQYPVWESLACDFLSIMSSSVLSKCVFSSAGITISKWCNSLKANPVEALQFCKCTSKSNLLFRQLSVLAETTQEGAESDEDDEDTGNEDWENWDSPVVAQ